MSRVPTLPDSSRCCLFLDIDGTLPDLAPMPGMVVVDGALRALLSRLARICEGAFAFVMGEITGTEWRLESPMAVRRWLESLLLQERVA